MKIALVGKNGSGKSACCDYLKVKYQFKVLSLSDILRESLKERQEKETRHHLMAMGNELKEKYGYEYLAKASYEKVKHQDTSVVFDSIRHPLEVSFLKNQSVLLLAIKASQACRFQRIQDRNRQGDLFDFQQFKEQEAMEAAGASQGQNLNACEEACEFFIENEGSLDDLKLKLDLFLDKVKI